MSPPIADPSASHMLTGANYSRTFAENLAERSHALRSHGRMVRPTTFLIWQVEVRALLRRATAERRPPCRPRHPPAPLGEFGHEFAERRCARVQGGAHRCARHTRRIFLFRRSSAVIRRFQALAGTELRIFLEQIESGASELKPLKAPLSVRAVGTDGDDSASALAEVTAETTI